MVREENQDTYCVTAVREGVTLAVVCDGMGGAAGGKLAASLACEEFVSRFCDIIRTESGIDLGFGEITSKDLIKNLGECKRAAVFAVTLGSDVDRLLIKLGKLMPSEQFVTDAIASALSETACDEAEKLIFDGLSHAPRFSPGYGDLPLELQKPLLNFLDAEKTVGITLSPSLLMTPTKSITAIAGIIE